jgi:nicotinate-nucleotide adenylyltransferase
VSDLELRRTGPSYTVDTLRTLARKRPGDEIYLVLGWDAARDIRSWHQPDEVMRQARLIVVSRPGYPSPTLADLAAAGIDAARTVLCDVRTPDVDATDVRRMARVGASLEGLIHPGVEAYLQSRRLYAA